MGKKTPHPIRIEGSVAYVTLTRGYEAIIDTVDVPLIDGRNWQAHVVLGHTTYACTNAQPTLMEARGTVRMHRHILGLPRSGGHVDHINGNGLDNRRGNLRLCTQAENAWNQGPHRDSSHGVKGVVWAAHARSWRARIMANGQYKHLGYFPTKEAAGEAYVKAAAELHGAFARLR